MLRVIEKEGIQQHAAEVRQHWSALTQKNPCALSALQQATAKQTQLCLAQLNTEPMVSAMASPFAAHIRACNTVLMVKREWLHASQHLPWYLAAGW